MNMMEMMVPLAILMGVLLGASQRTVRVFMSTLIMIFVLFSAPAAYQPIGKFLSAMLMAPADKGDGVAFLLTALTIAGVLELVMRKSFKETFLPSLGVLDQLIGALIGLVWAILAASLMLMPLIYVGSISSSSRMIAIIQSLVRPLAAVTLRLIYAPGDAPVLDNFLG